MYRDDYTNFSFNELESENFKVWITNKNDLKRSMSPNFSDKFNTPTGSQIRYHEGTTIDKQDFKLSCTAVDVTLNEWRAITEWLSPLKQGKLRFEWNDKYYYMVKVSKAPSGTMFMKGRVDDIMGQLYIITFDLEFTTAHDWAALGNYAEQNSMKEIDMSVYNNEYYMPSIIMRDKYVYRTSLTKQTVYPSADVVLVSTGDTYDFTTLVAGNYHIKEVSSGKTPLPEKIIFEIGYFPVIQCWNPRRNGFDTPITLYSNNINGLQNIPMKISTENYTLTYTAKYNDNKEVELQLSYKGVVDEYENRFVLVDVKEYNDNTYEMPSATLTFENLPDKVYRGKSYIVKAIVENSNESIYVDKDKDTNYDIVIVKDNDIFITIPIDYASDDISFNICLKDPLPGNPTRVIKKTISREINSPNIIATASKTIIGVEDVVYLEAKLNGVAKNNFQWVVSSDDLEYVEILDYESLETQLTALKPKDEIIIKARNITESGEKLDSNEITLKIAASTVRLLNLDGTNAKKEFIKLDDTYELWVDVIGQSKKGYISYIYEKSLANLSEQDYIEKGEGDKKIKIWAADNIEGNEQEFTLVAERRNVDGNTYISNEFKTKIVRGIELKGINAKQSIQRLSNTEFAITYLTLTDENVVLNYFKDKGYTKQLLSSNTDVLVINEENNSFELAFKDIGKTKLTFNLLDGSNIVDSTSLDIDVLSDDAVVTWNSEWITVLEEDVHYMNVDQKVNDFVKKIVEQDGSYIVRVGYFGNGYCKIARYQEAYRDGEEEPFIGVSTHDYQVYDQSVSSIQELIENAVSFDILIRSKYQDGERTYKYFIPLDEYNAEIQKSFKLGFLDQIINPWKTGDQRENYNRDIKSASSTYFFPESFNYQEIRVREKNGSILSIVDTVRNNEDRDILTIATNSWKNDYIGCITEGTFYLDQVMFIENCSQGYYDSERNFFSFSVGIDFGSEYDVISLVKTVLDEENHEERLAYAINSNGRKLDVIMNFARTNDWGWPAPDFGNVTYTFKTKQPLVDIKSIYSEPPVETVETASPMMFTMGRSVRTTSNDEPSQTQTDPYLKYLPAKAVPQLRVMSNRGEVVGYVYILDGVAYYRHYFLPEVVDFSKEIPHWNEIIGVKDYYEFKSHPSYYLINHNYDTEDEDYNGSLKLILKTNTNTAICNTGVFNMYPMFFIKGGCKISDSLNTYYSFLTNTTMKNLFVTINSRTSTMLHNGYTIDAAYNAIGAPLFKNVVNENQLVVDSGRPELLKAVFVSEEIVEYEGNDTGIRKAKFLINSKPLYGRRDKFAIHIFNKEFANKLSNSFNKDVYNSKLYYDSVSDDKDYHILLNSPIIDYVQTDRGWEMYITYRAYANNVQYYDFIRSGGSKGQYSNKAIISDIAADNLLYISICDYKELEIRSEGEDYSVGCQSRGVI